MARLARDASSAASFRVPSQENLGIRDERPQLVVGEASHRRERIETMPEQELRLVDVANPGQGALVEQCLAECDRRPGAQVSQRSGGIEGAAEQIGTHPP